jgi:hypothetical protein
MPVFEVIEGRKGDAATGTSGLIGESGKTFQQPS